MFGRRLGVFRYYKSMQFEKRLRFNHRKLVGISRERMYMQLGFAGLEIDIAERLKAADLHIREVHENPAITRETLQVRMALAIQIGAHPLNLEIGHIAHSLAQRAFMRTRAAELEPFDQASLRQHLAGRADHFAQADILPENADDVRAAGDPDKRLVFFGLDFAFGVNLEQLRMQRTLKQVKGQFVDSYINLWCFHIRYGPVGISLEYKRIIHQTSGEFQGLYQY